MTYREGPTEVWVVEDSRLYRESLRQLIERESDFHCGLAVETCEELFAALDAGDRPQLVLMDLSLPGASGIEGTSRLHGQAPECPIIVLTVHEDDEHVFEAICAGACGYLLKPSTPQNVVAAMRQALEGAAPLNPYVGRRILRFFSRLPSTFAGGDEEYGLTARETEILRLLVDGLDKPAIAQQLSLSYHTVSNHLRKVYRKLHVSSQTQAVAKAIREGLL